MAEDDNKSKEKALEEWLKITDKPVGTKEEDKRDTGSDDK